MFRDLWTDAPWYVRLLFGAIALLFVYAIFHEVYVWPRYLEEHNCVPSGKQRWRNTVDCHIQADGHSICLPTVKVEDRWDCDNGPVWR